MGEAASSIMFQTALKNGAVVENSKQFQVENGSIELVQFEESEGVYIFDNGSPSWCELDWEETAAAFEAAAIGNSSLLEELEGMRQIRGIRNIYAANKEVA